MCKPIKINRFEPRPMKYQPALNGKKQAPVQCDPSEADFYEVNMSGVLKHYAKELGVQELKLDTFRSKLQFKLPFEDDSDDDLDFTTA